MFTHAGSQAKETEPAWKNKELLTKLKHKKEAYERWKHSHVTQEKYRDTV